MNSFMKIIVGLILLGAPLALYAYAAVNGEPVNMGLKVWPITALTTLIVGAVPPFLALIGLFIIWLELDEWRIEKELKKEEEKEEEKPKKKKK